MQVDPEKTREEVLDAAAKLFARQGFIKTTLRDISQKSRVSEGTIYRVFKGRKKISSTPKDEIYLALYKKGWDDFLGFVKEKLPNYPDDSFEQLEALIKDTMSWLAQDQKNPGLQTTIVMQYRDIYLYFTDEVDDKAFREWLALIDQIINRGKRRGVFHKDIDTEIMREALIGVGERFLMINRVAKITKFTHYGFASDLGNLIPAFRAVIQGFMTPEGLENLA